MRELKFRIFEDEVMSNLDCLHLPHTEDSIKLMQYTGLKDKNGVEIYDGSIVNMFETKIPTEIIFKNGAFGYMSGGKYSYFISIAGNSNMEYDKGKCTSIEVVGNIYQNKELLDDCL